MYKVSVIIPVYNAEKTITDAINSVINQTIGFENIELILIDDKSTDNSKQVIKPFDEKYENIKFIQLNENSGLPSHPRNVGIENSTSPYLMFADNDDMLTPASCKTLYDAITSTDSDVVECSVCYKFNDGFYSFSKNQTNEIFLVEDKSTLRCTCWGFIIKSDLVKKNNIKFPLHVPEDGIFITTVVGHASTFYRMPNFYGYAYTVESEDDVSYIHDINNDRFLDYLNGHYPYVDTLRKFDIDEILIFTSSVSILILMFFKVNASKSVKISSLKKLHDFEEYLDFDVELPSKPLNILNKFIINENYNIAFFISSIASILYKNNKIKNFIHRQYSDLEKLNFN